MRTLSLASVFTIAGKRLFGIMVVHAYTFWVFTTVPALNYKALKEMLTSLSLNTISCVKCVSISTGPSFFKVHYDCIKKKEKRKKNYPPAHPAPEFNLISSVRGWEKTHPGYERFINGPWCHSIICFCGVTPPHPHFGLPFLPLHIRDLHRLKVFRCMDNRHVLHRFSWTPGSTEKKRTVD